MLLYAVAITAPAAIHAQKIVLHEIVEAQSQYHQHDEQHNNGDSPFLSATLKTNISSVQSYITPLNKLKLEHVMKDFLQHIFMDQDVFDVSIVGVSIFEEELVKNDSGGGRRKLVLNRLQKNLRNFQFQRDGYDDGYDDDNDDDDDDDDDDDTVFRPDPASNLRNIQFDNDDEVQVGLHLESKDWEHVNTLIQQQEEEETEYEDVVSPASSSSNNQHDLIGPGYTLSFATVISAEHTSSREQYQSSNNRQTTYISHTEFQDMLVHICNKFNDHFVGFVRAIDDDTDTDTDTENGDDESGKSDAYFSNVESVVVSGYEEEEEGDGHRIPGKWGHQQHQQQQNHHQQQQQHSGQHTEESMGQQQQQEIESLLDKDDNWDAAGDGGMALTGNNEDEQQKQQKLNSLEIVAIVLSSLILIPIAFFSIRLRR